MITSFLNVLGTVAGSGAGICKRDFIEDIGESLKRVCYIKFDQALAEKEALKNAEKVK